MISSGLTTASTGCAEKHAPVKTNVKYNCELKDAKSGS
jgi:hypothetical protein